MTVPMSLVLLLALSMPFIMPLVQFSVQTMSLYNSCDINSPSVDILNTPSDISVPSNGILSPFSNLLCAF